MDWIEIFRAGDYGPKGRYSEADLDRIASSYDPALHEAPVVIGHPEHDRPAYGWVEALKREGKPWWASCATSSPALPSW